MGDRPSWAPSEVNLAHPSVARVYDYYLGGSHNFESDRAFARQVLRVLPEMATIAAQNRAFLRRAVLYLCAQGIDQFIDLGSGIPTVGNVHEVAASACDRSRVAYVDHDPVAVTHSRELLRDVDQAVVVAADLTDPGSVLQNPVLRDHIDLSRPVAILLVSVLHFVGDDRLATECVREYTTAAAPGSHVVISHASAEGQPAVVDAEALYNEADSPNPMRMRSHAEVSALFDGLEIVEPGVVRIPLWRPDAPDEVGTDPERYPGYAGVGRRR